MRRKLLLINMVLLAAVALIGNLVFEEWQSYEKQNNVGRIRVKVAPPAPVPTAKPATAAHRMHLQPAGNYNVLFEKNLFSPNRREVEPPEVVAEGPKVPPMPGQPMMTGVSLIGDKKVAYVQEPGQPPKTFQVGDTIMNFGRVTEIRNDGMVFTWGDVTHNVNLQERPPVARGPVVARMAATVIKIGSGKKGAGAGAGASQPGAGTPATPTIQVSTVGTGAGPAGGVNPLGNVNGGAARGMQQQRGNQQAGPGFIPTQVYPNQNLSNQVPQQNPVFIDTPFGRIARPPRRNQ